MWHATRRMSSAWWVCAQDENEDMGRDLAEGHVHALERQLALAKTALEDMRRAYLQLEDVTQQLDNEAEDLQAQARAPPI